MQGCGRWLSGPLCGELPLITQKVVNQSPSDDAITGGPGLCPPLPFPASLFSQDFGETSALRLDSSHTLHLMTRTAIKMIAIYRAPHSIYMY